MCIRDREQTVNPNLTLAALKLIELISVVGLEEFHLHQWIFVFDYFGLQLKYFSLKENDKDKQLKGQSPAKKLQMQTKMLPKLKFHSPFIFQPYITSCIPEEFDLSLSLIHI
eukprot:TRINITY_DN8832_c0_g2_i1.p2 TRINITY_DN8832_c0_g2~~TRINITY_DN8832_c0_g2_i1.p2  ORF type:complete len:112 (-),score=16.68 TRINITY_DN8832_c0_g2_i1:62-397(-)